MRVGGLYSCLFNGGTGAPVFNSGSFRGFSGFNNYVCTGWITGSSGDYCWDVSFCMPGSFINVGAMVRGRCSF